MTQLDQSYSWSSDNKDFITDHLEKSVWVSTLKPDLNRSFKYRYKGRSDGSDNNTKSNHLSQSVGRMNHRPSVCIKTYCKNMWKMLPVVVAAVMLKKLLYIDLQQLFIYCICHKGPALLFRWRQSLISLTFKTAFEFNLALLMHGGK